MPLKRCKKCVIPETQETIGFDESGLCNICKGQTIKHEEINWNEKKMKLDDIIESYGIKICGIQQTL